MNAPVKPAAFGAATAVATPQAAPIIRFEQVGKTYPGRRGQAAVTALRDIDLTVPRGGVVGVIGRSGAGKSTLIRLVNGLERATAGRLLIEDEDVTGLDESGWRARRRRTGMIFQHFNLLSSRTVADNVALPLEIAGAKAEEIRRRVTELLALVGLDDKAGRYPAELSGGQKQRVGIARALATRPSILLCDEATSALDPETTGQILALLRKVNRELGLTILLITHEMQVIKEIADQVAVIEGGTIVEQGGAFDVLTRPQHPTTARFLESVTGVTLPDYLAHRLQAAPSPCSSAVVRVTFTGGNATAPVISRLGSTIGVDVNILAGRIDAIADRPFGQLLIGVPSEEPTVSAVLGALRSLELDAEVLGHVA
ncbi:methionine ABC transporter ATP-binding protein [Bosea sp. TWI1241]|uniref:methionine ABC transporter ATP-binding protein n=1 Tax=Bosea sp. TWI1241 TaxID=3148904 RepID=UPI00320B372F